MAKKVVLFPEIGRVKFYLHLRDRIVKCVSKYIFFVSNKKKHAHKNAKETKENRKTKEKEKVRENVLFAVNSICGKSNWIRRYRLWIALCTFNLRDQRTKTERVLKNNIIWKTFVYICLLYVEDGNQSKLM